jgi:hypothetical protein
MVDENTWRPCGSCKEPIVLGAKYYLCGISTCRKSVYCSLPCFDDHASVFRHKDAWAEERVVKKNSEQDNITSPSKIATVRRVTPSNKAETQPDVLVVASKLKDYIRSRSGGLSTSASVLERLSDMIRMQCDKAIERALQDGRKTVMERDFYF